MASEVARDSEMKGIPWWASVMSGLFLIVGAVTSRRKRKKKKRPLNFNVQKKINWLPVSNWELQEECVLWWMCVLRTMRFSKNSKMGSIFILSAYHELTTTRLPMNRVKSVLAASEFWCVAPQPGPSDCRIGIVCFENLLLYSIWAQGWAGERVPHMVSCVLILVLSHTLLGLWFFLFCFYE